MQNQNKVLLFMKKLLRYNKELIVAECVNVHMVYFL